MKVFVADNVEKGVISSDNYHWCEANELLMFNFYQLDNSPSMCGIKTGKFTTNIVVRDVDITKEQYRKLIKNEYELTGYLCVNGMAYADDEDYENEIGFNIDQIVDELLEKANKFNDGDKIKCIGREISLK